MNTVGTRVWDAFNAFWPVELLDSGLADALGLETYEHGTSPGSYDSILMNGIDPRFGGTGGETGYLLANGRKKLAFADMRTVNRFYVFDYQARYGSILPHLVGSTIKSIWVRQYAILASIGVEKQKGENIFRNIIGCLLGLAVPIVKVRFRPDDPAKNFVNDEFFEPGFASYTEQKISVDHIGIQGTLNLGLNKEWWTRVQKHPALFMLGVVKIITAVALAALCIVASAYSTIALYLVVSYLALKTIQAVAQFSAPLLCRSTQKPQPPKLDEEASIIHSFTDNVDAPDGQPEAILFSGCSGSGKSTEKKRIIAGKERQYVQLDSDQIMEKMPKYHRLLSQGVKEAASIMHRDSLRLRDKVMKRAISEKKSFILEGTGSNLALYKDIIKELRRNNYRIKLVRCEIDLLEAKKRVREREQLTGRHVPEEAVEMSFTQSALHFNQLKPLVDDFQVVNA